jgi:mono/diheme cytochrome c family protein
MRVPVSCRRFLPVGLLALPAAGLAWTAVPLAAAPVPAPPTVQFGRDIRPLFVERCIACHGPQRQDGGLRLDLRSRALAGGDAGPSIVPRSPERSELLSRLTTSDPKHRMPLGGKPLSPAQIQAVRTWITAGAVWPDALAGKETTGEHWSFRLLRRPPVPKVRDAARIRNPIDAFILARLEAKGRTFSPEARPRTLIRRLYLDLLGLPPTAEEVEAFVRECRIHHGDTETRSVRDRGNERKEEGKQKMAATAAPSPSPISQPPTLAGDAYEKLVDKLLASPAFGERWGRHWLDLARFAESDGYENDQIRPNAWRYRDWVIQAFNADMPFDRFTVEQLAGDLLPNPTPEQLIATGFHRNTLWNSAASADKEEFRTFAIKDRTDTTATTWMGLTAGCAKCHTHKYDPITQKEYYQLYAFFNRTDNEDAPIPGGKAASLHAVQRTTKIHLRGGFLNLGEKVIPGTPAFLPALKPRATEPDRLDLARWLVSADNPLTARVAANQTWQHLFGQGLVPTPENYGRSGMPPTHPELLDWLAAAFRGVPRSEFRVSGSTLAKGNADPGTLNAEPNLAWSQKALIRLIVTSAAYRQASEHRAALAGSDGDNVLLGRQNRFRVEAEIVRDLSLSVSGLLNPKLGGPSIVPPFPEGLLEQRFTNEALKMPGDDRHRRGVYIHVQRTLTHPSLAAFDVADGNQSCVRRDRSTTPIQALTLLNDPVFVECAQALGRRLISLSPERDERLRRGFQLCVARQPSAEELALLVQLVERQRQLGAADEAVWAGVARALLNLEEFTTRE